MAFSWALGVWLAALPARADQAPPASAWTPAPVEGATTADNPAAVERIQFGNQFQNQGLDQWCDQIPYTIPISQDMVEQLGAAEILNGGTFNGNRQFFRYPDGSVSINDQLELKIDLGYALGAVAKAEKAVGFFFGGSIDGQSLVTQPMHTSNSCKELKRFINPFDFKTVLPLNARRLSQMDVGELWIIPMTFQISFEPLDAADAPAMGGGLKLLPSAAYLSLGASKTSDPTITVFRVGPKETRLKLHLDQVKAFNAQLGGVFGPIPATDIGTPGIEVLLSRVLPTILPTSLQLFSRQLDDILGVQAGLGASHSAGQQILLQYTLDPTDSEQMADLAKVIRGDLSILRAMKQFATIKSPDASSPAMRADLDKLRQKHDLALKLPANLSGIDDYKTSALSASLSVPVAIAFTRSTTWSQDHYVTEGAQGRDVQSYKMLHQSTLSLLHFPLVGALVNADHAQGAQVLVDRSSPTPKPYLVYTQEWGILREKRAAIAKALSQADGLLGAVGAGSVDLRLPDELLSSTRDGHYHKGYLDLSLVLGPDAVAQIVAASAKEVVNAFADILTGGERGLFAFVIAHAKLGDNGVIAFDRQSLSSLPAYRDADDEEQWRLEATARSLCSRASKLYQSIASLRSLAAQPEAQAQALFRLASGRAGVSRDDFERIAMRLASAADVAGDVLLHLDKDKTSASNYTVRYVLNPTLFGDSVLKGISIVERGFIAPNPAAPLND